MKTYNKPNTEIHHIELQQMIAATGEGPGIKTENVNNNEDVLGKEHNFSSNSVWGDSAEEE